MVRAFLSWQVVRNLREEILVHLLLRATTSVGTVLIDCQCHYNDVIMGAIASQITSLTIVYSTIYSGTDQGKHQSSASLAFVRGIHRWPVVNSPHKWPVTRKMFPFDDVIMVSHNHEEYGKMDWYQTKIDKYESEYVLNSVVVIILSVLLYLASGKFYTQEFYLK